VKCYSSKIQYILILEFLPLIGVFPILLILKSFFFFRSLNVSSEKIIHSFLLLVIFSSLAAMFTLSQIIVISILSFDPIVPKIAFHELIQIHTVISCTIFQTLICSTNFLISTALFNTLSLNSVSKINISQSHRNLSTYHQFFLTISTIQSKYIFSKKSVLDGVNFSDILVKPDISINIM